MFREEIRKRLMTLTEKLVLEEVKMRDSYGAQLVIVVNPIGGDISLRCVDETCSAGITMAGVGGGDNRPLTKEALRLLALAIQEESGHV